MPHTQAPWCWEPAEPPNPSNGIIATKKQGWPGMHLVYWLCVPRPFECCSERDPAYVVVGVRDSEKEESTYVSDGNVSAVHTADGICTFMATSGCLISAAFCGRSHYTGPKHRIRCRKITISRCTQEYAAPTLMQTGCNGIFMPLCPACMYDYTLPGDCPHWLAV